MTSGRSSSPSLRPMRPKAELPQCLRAQPPDRLRRLRRPFPPQQPFVRTREMAVQRQQHAHGVHGHFLDAVLRRVAHRHPAAGGCLQVDVVEAGAAPLQELAAFGQQADDLGVDRRDTEEQGVDPGRRSDSGLQFRVLLVGRIGAEDPRLRQRNARVSQPLSFGIEIPRCPVSHENVSFRWHVRLGCVVLSSTVLSSETASRRSEIGHVPMCSPAGTLISRRGHR